MKDVLSTGEAAKICGVSISSIIKWYESGKLKGFRVPGSKFRRITRDQLRKFMLENNIPTDAFDQETQP